MGKDKRPVRVSQVHGIATPSWPLFPRKRNKTDAVIWTAHLTSPCLSCFILPGLAVRQGLLVCLVLVCSFLAQSELCSTPLYFSVLQELKFAALVRNSGNSWTIGLPKVTALCRDLLKPNQLKVESKVPSQSTTKILNGYTQTSCFGQLMRRNFELPDESKNVLFCELEV